MNSKEKTYRDLFTDLTRLRYFTLVRPEGRDPYPVAAAGALDWAEWFETADRQVARTTVEPGVEVSTVFIGFATDMFETLVFGGPLDGAQERTDTWAEALEAHARMVRYVQEGDEDDGKSDAGPTGASS